MKTRKTSIIQIKPFKDDMEYTTRALERIPEFLYDYMDSHHLKPRDILAVASIEHLKNYQLSRLLNRNPDKKKNRPVHLSEVAELRRVLGISIDRLLDGEDPEDSETDESPEAWVKIMKMDTECLWRFHEQIDAELKRRMMSNS